MKLIVFFLAAYFCTAAQGPVLTSNNLFPVSKQELAQLIAAKTL